MAGRDPGRRSSTQEGVARIGVVDDDDSMRSALARLLRSAGFEVETFASAKEVLGEPSATLSCLLLDVRMPGMTGLELQKRLARLWPDVPVVFMSAYPEKGARTGALSAGALGFLRKPFGEEDLLAILAEVLGSTGQRRHGRGTLGGDSP